MSKQRFKLELQAQINGEWHTIAEMSSCGSQDTGKMRRVADNSTVPTRLIEIHD